MVMSLPPDFSEFLKLLNCQEVDYILVGGFAVGFHGYPRATSDMDIWISQSLGNATRVVAAIRAFGFDTPNLTEDLFLQRRRIVRMGHPPIRIEVMNEIDGVTFEDCRPRAISQILNETNWPAADPKTSTTSSNFPEV
jgi:hypothetical protein